MDIGDAADGACVHGALKPVLQIPLDESPAGRDQAQETDEVCQQAGSEKYRRRGQDQHAVDDRIGGRSSGRQVGSEAREGAGTLPPGQRRPNNARRDDDADGGRGADALANFNEQEQLDNRHGDEEEKEASHGVVRRCAHSEEV